MTAPPVDFRLIARTDRLTREAGRGAVVALEALTGGKNNRVYRVILADGPPLVLKSYFSDPRDARDRLGAEWAFLTYARNRGVQNLPKPLARDRAARVGLYSHIEGRRLAAGEVDARHIDAAIAFVLAVNAPPRDPWALEVGSEACFSLAQHVATVERRVAKLLLLDPDAPLRAEAARFVSGRLAPLWAVVKAGILAEAGPSYDDELPTPDIVVSPSDFGFHNALVDGTGIAFLDFEYAGRDDPAKLICDFFCQPEVPVPACLFGEAARRIVQDLGLSADHAARCELLLDLYRVKWVCIMLNPFLPLGAARRAFAGSIRARDEAAAQLARAEAKLAECGSSRP